ncbi:stearoyl-CoA desaturase 5-like isoform X2 [Varroa destructor]|uniref:Fatty acid desaturase domain-containing protein n=1 Tax=Varroa destructor TaxID=109461 RepID=A0A7M7KGI9_VARDE|nr:stearoyl-CoA desaturase 5-like isoform X2 [Varroa destructor]
MCTRSANRQLSVEPCKRKVGIFVSRESSIQDIDDIEVQKVGERVERLLIDALEKAEELWASTGITTVKLSELLYRNILKVGLLHLLALYGLLYIPYMKWETAAWSFFYLSVSGLSVTAGAHRLWCHRSYKARWPLRAFLMLANCCVAQNDIYDWVRDHRVHHKFSDTDADPHNITRGLFFSHVGWLFVRKHPEVTRLGSKVDCSDVAEDPIVAFQIRHYVVLTLLFATLIPTCLPVYCWDESIWVAFYICTIIRLVIQLNVTWSVNSFAHYFGEKPFDNTIWPTETRFVAFAAAGEGWHNYHHTFPHDYACSELGWYLNPTKLFIDFMWLIGMAYDCKQESMDSVKFRRGDGTRRPAHASCELASKDASASSHQF